MQKGTITVENGVVVAVEAHQEGSGRAAVGGQPLYDTLKNLEKDGWKAEGELPPFTTEGKYTIPIVRVP
jgi:hypothetical protein